jgi:hypothetical protein
MRTGLTGGVAFAAEYGAANLWMKGDVVMLAAIVAYDVKALWSMVTYDRRLFSSAFSAALRSHHIALVKHLLFFFGEQKDLLTLHTRDFDIRHRCFLLVQNKRMRVWQ